MTSDVIEKKDEKFYFTNNVFDEGYVDEAELEDLPPVFTEGELEQAKKKAFENGKAQGIEETTNSQKQQVAQALHTISQNMTMLTDQEAQREVRFEQESIGLCLSLFKKLYPLYEEKYGLEELNQLLSTTLKSAQNQRDISIHVTPDAVEGVQKTLTALSQKGLGISFMVHGDEHIGQHACKMNWTDGGAIIDRGRLATEIESAVQQMLAGDDTNSHDGGAEAAEERTDGLSTEQSATEKPEELKPSEEQPENNIAEQTDE